MNLNNAKANKKARKKAERSQRKLLRKNRSALFNDTQGSSIIAPTPSLYGSFYKIRSPAKLG